MDDSSDESSDESADDMANNSVPSESEMECPEAPDYSPVTVAMLTQIAS